jgi:hypothetical protein
MLSFNQYQTEYDNTLFEEAMNLLYEKLITFKGGAKYGQIVFLSGGAGCFDGDTLVKTESGYMTIKDITPNTMVYTQNEETGETELKRVKDVIEYSVNDQVDELLELTFENGETIVCTENHLFHIDGVWIKAKDISDLVAKKTVSNRNVYDLSVEGNHNYFITKSDMLVHNSGKGFASSTFMDSNLFKIRDVDSWKKSFIAIAELKNKYPEIRGLNLREKKDVAAMHAFVKKMGIKNKTLDLLLTDVKADRLPNIMFDITGKEMADFDEVVPRLIEVGYASADLHLVWILANWKASFVANLRRSRVVPADIFLGTHRGAAQTMVRLLEQQKMPRGMNGAFHVVMNNRDNTVYFEPGETYKGRTVPATDSKGKKIEIVKSFYYITVKDAGKSFRPESAWKKELFDQIVANVPGGESVLNQAVADLSESYNNS